MEPRKSQKEGKEDQRTLKQLRRFPLFFTSPFQLFLGSMDIRRAILILTPAYVTIEPYRCLGPYEPIERLIGS